MNDGATARVPQSESHLRILPLERARADWDALVASHPEATFYHRGPWLEVLRRAFGVRPSVAIMECSDSTVAGCLFAKGGNPLRRSLVSLPFSDFCPPLARSDSSRESLMARMAGAIPPRSSLEIRGVAGFAPWHVVDHFQRWTLDLSRPFHAIERAADRETRRHVRRARAAGVTIDRLNSAAVRIRGKREFPRWPCESALIDYWRDWLKLSLQRLNASDAWHIGFWPDGMKSCIVLTHDVEGPIGMSRMERMADLEERYNFRSAWNLPLAQYAIDWNLVNRLRWRGFEFGAHGLSHDGRLFRSESDFSELAPILEKLARIHGMNGFRAPSTLRRVEWISRLSFDFDCSFSDSDPYEPQPGGTCSVFPFFLPNLVELPYTMPQDHTLIHLLRRSPMHVWATKAQWIESMGGMILTLVHPGYCGSGRNLDEYENLLIQLNDFQFAWRALPSEVSAWWWRRNQMRLTVDGDSPCIEGPGSGRAAARRLSSEPLAR